MTSKSRSYDFSGKKRKVQDEGSLPKKKSATGGKKGQNFAKEKEKRKITKKMKRQLAAVQQRKANKLTVCLITVHRILFPSYLPRNLKSLQFEFHGFLWQKSLLAS